ncbi:CBU_0592 family membrane protein [Mucilaginibacter myungsuensis]|uniref:CBU_0592 family membrane protein n=1 Tax=Mucilaginibacter myungsuensis TaxID=649104 RepID=UPI001D16021F|nr:hypothetical protein [Mucilaginibacter myungsuensis]MDN3597407.1 hypothetical protein [Mucilaginibacter myungsuensis]
MKLSDIIASVGVTILLVGFFLNLNKKIASDGKLYASLNFIGAAMCGVSSYMISFYPFVILEGVWASVALYSLVKVPRGTSN